VFGGLVMGVSFFCR